MCRLYSSKVAPPAVYYIRSFFTAEVFDREYAVRSGPRNDFVVGDFVVVVVGDEQSSNSSRFDEIFEFRHAMTRFDAI